MAISIAASGHGVTAIPLGAATLQNGDEHKKAASEGRLAGC